MGPWAEFHLVLILMISSLICFVNLGIHCPGSSELILGIGWYLLNVINK